MNAHLAADLAEIEGVYDAFVALVKTLDADALNWTPLPSDTNSISVLVTHTVGSTLSLVSRAAGETVSRDRDAEFRVKSDSKQLVDLIERSRAELKRKFGLLESVDVGTLRPWRRGGMTEDAQVSIAFLLEHAVSHAGEHKGHVELTAQLWKGRK